jgi:predicted HicB family RNase H-like nuclease
MGNKSVQDYLSLPYNYIIQPMHDQSGNYFYGRVLELDGCQSTGETFLDAYHSLCEAMKGYIETKIDNGFEIPEPTQSNDYSGKFVIRIPKSLHFRLSVEAEKEGISLNQYALYKLSM